jgi:hypothetical protein
VANKRFKTGDRVIIQNATRLLNFKTGEIVGRSQWGVDSSDYIVLLDEPVNGIDGFYHKAVNLSDVNLEYVS